MKASILFSASSVLAVVFGTVLVLAPEQLMSMFGITLGAGGQLVARLFGASLIGFAVIAWSSRDAPDSQARQATIIGMLTGVVGGFVITLFTKLGGSSNDMGWSIVILYLLMSLGWGSTMLRKAKGQKN